MTALELSFALWLLIKGVTASAMVRKLAAAN
jgi:hypothetical protein